MSLNVAGVQVGPLLRDVLEKDMLEGVTNAQLNLAMAGDQPDQIKQTLNGKGQLRFNDGAIVGIDLAGMVRSQCQSCFWAGTKTFRTTAN